MKTKEINNHSKLTPEYIKGYQATLKEYPSFKRAYMADNGQTGLTNACYFTHKCGCEIMGCGTLQFPLEIKFCKKHKAAK